MKSKWVTLGLTCIASVGVIVTGWLSAKCHDKAKDKTEKKDKIIAYIPAGIAGAGTIACIFGSHHLSRKEIAALTASCAAITANREKIVEKVKKILPPDEARKVLRSANKETPTVLKVAEVVEETGRGDIKFLDIFSGRCFRSSWTDVLAGEKKLIADLKNGMECPYNDLLGHWGLRKSESCQDYGWPSDPDWWESVDPDEPIIFEHFKAKDEKGEDMYVIDCVTNPVLGWMLDGGN